MKEPDFNEMRKQMVEEQLIPRGISDKKVLEAFRKVPRHEFVPLELRERAYGDYPLPVGNSQTISQPYMVALMTECLALKGDERVLEIGTGSGYQAAVLAEIAKEVYSVERIPKLAEDAKTNLEKAGYANCRIKVDDGTLGWQEYAPYDGIIVTAGAPGVPENLVAQLKDGGRLVIPVGSRLSQVLTIVDKSGGIAAARQVLGCIFVPLIGEDGWKC